jgi:glucose/arabinose dehydrogenase
LSLAPLISGLTQPVFLTSAKDQTDRKFILEQVGRIRVMQPGATTATLFLDITSKVLFEGERGLLGLTFHPQFAANGRYYVNYTRRPDGATVVAEYRNGVEQRILFTVLQPYENHNGGMIEFGPDGYMYIGMGDGGSANDPQNRAQNPNELLGKCCGLMSIYPTAGPRFSLPASEIHGDFPSIESRAN